MSPYRLYMGNHAICRLNWNIRQCGQIKFLNMDLQTAEENIVFQLHEFEEIRNEAYESRLKLQGNDKEMALIRGSPLILPI
ncbi:unnamed protein product [Rhodiola kirilowii]